MGFSVLDGISQLVFQTLILGIPLWVIILILVLLYLKFPSAWSTARKILGSRSRGAALIVLGIFLFSLDESFKIVRGVLNLPQESSTLGLGTLAFFAMLWGMMSYLWWEKPQKGEE